jgi:23S rRNA (guanosine2251-2'-O)-methyltransferase
LEWSAKMRRNKTGGDGPGDFRRNPEGSGRGQRPAAQRAVRESPIRRGAGFRKPGPDLVVLYGLHAVREALRAGKRKLLDIHATAAAAERIGADAAAAHVPIHLVEGADLDRRLGHGAVHQGLLLEARALETIDLSEIETRSGIVLVLDQITDPHNVGAILRTAAAFAVDALVVTERHAPDFSGVLAKAASGGLEHLPIASVVNLARALDELGEMDFLRVGLDSEGEVSLEAASLRRPLALVLGAEGSGLRRLTRERCDIVARLDMPGPIKSLNVSNACAVALTIVSQATKG